MYSWDLDDDFRETSEDRRRRPQLSRDRKLAEMLFGEVYVSLYREYTYDS